MVSGIGNIGSTAPSQLLRPVSQPLATRGGDSDGDSDGSKPGVAESKNRPVSATIGNTINTTA
ncbi:hypothetical protein [Aquitalea aquatilis]|uniref:hypothetical protein n=1 Tax=Aquitalea aquatilis TaxID=1537400 RepID=UPI0010BDCF94|nr:hypothetical protein [Aquitalea aquatilis]